ncbi:MAG: nucleotidyltransferase family protein [Actinomycetota bacterium]|nr:nucleotidyltransferase family protein [Actinomycetota bacterium]
MVEALDREQKFVQDVLANPVTEAILDRLPQLGLADCWLTAGASFQTVWNVLDGRDPQSGIGDYDIFYFVAADTSYEAEDLAIGRARAVFADLDATIEVRNEARVHLWYEDHFGVPAKPFTSTRDAIDHFASTTCCVGLTRTASGEIDVYAPHGFTDLYDKRIRPNRVLAPQAVYEAKVARWLLEWPTLLVEPWDDDLRIR